KKYYDFPILRSPQVFINAITQSLPILLLTSLYGPISAGFYSLSRSVMNIPVQLIGKSVGDVFYPRISTAANNNENITSLIKKAVISLAIFGFVPFGIIFLIGPWIFAFIFGQEWLIAGKYARWLALWVFTIFIYQPCIRTFPVISAQGLHLIYTLLTLAVNVISLVIGFYFFTDDLISIALFSISGVIVNIILIFITLNLSQKFDER